MEILSPRSTSTPPQYKYRTLASGDVFKYQAQGNANILKQVSLYVRITSRPISFRRPFLTRCHQYLVLYVLVSHIYLRYWHRAIQLVVPHGANPPFLGSSLLLVLCCCFSSCSKSPRFGKARIHLTNSIITRWSLYEAYTKKKQKTEGTSKVKFE